MINIERNEITSTLQRIGKNYRPEKIGDIIISGSLVTGGAFCYD
jgi:hypothetical protein